VRREFQYSLADCDCGYCLYQDSKTKLCRIEVCCCEEEKRLALARLCQSGSAWREEVKTCRA
jgi:hypothetical protein